MKFTYGIVTYNSESTIIETLESIKYQINLYGSDFENYLVISDDCSKDFTLNAIENWLQINRNIFYDVKVLSTKVNSGLCVNYSLMLENIKTDFFIQLAGDDLICSQNIYTKIIGIPENELHVFQKISFNSSGIINNLDDYVQQLFYSKFRHTNKKDLWILEVLSPYSSVEICFNKKHYSNGCLEYIKKFRNFEDDTSLFYILTHNKATYFNFDMAPLVLYRREDKSLTKIVNSPGQIAFLDDLYVFRKHTLKNEKNILVKMILVLIVWDNFLMKHRFAAERCLDRKIKCWINNYTKKKVLNDKKYEYDRIKYDLLIENESNYLKLIKDKTIEFYRLSGIKDE